jgi:hypothetical protein
MVDHLVCTSRHHPTPMEYNQTVLHCKVIFVISCFQQYVTTLIDLMYTGQHKHKKCVHPCIEQVKAFHAFENYSLQTV